MKRMVLMGLMGWLTAGNVLMNSAPASSPENTKPDNPAVVAGNAFLGDLYAQFKGQAGNIFFSPYSISSALTMTYRGARGETAVEMAKVLHLPADSALLDAGFATLHKALQGSGKDQGFELSVANGLWGQKGEPFLPAFEENLQNNYGAGLEEMDFITAPEPARLKINAWVEGQTHDRIKNLLPPKSIDDATRLVLTNAIYFKAEWAKQFAPELTKPGDFRTNGLQNPVKASLMVKQSKFQYVEDEKCQALVLDYRAGRSTLPTRPFTAGDSRRESGLAMIVLLPKPGTMEKAGDALLAGQTALEEAFTGKYVGGLIEKMTECEVHVTLPKWKLTQTRNLSDTLQHMGMKRAFVWKEADFTGMANNPDWLISLVLHQAFVKVDEEGTEATAATAVGLMPGCAIPPKAQQPVEFKADHVFLYVIVHKPSGAILFAGRVADPTKSE